MTKQRRLSNLSFVLLALVILLCVNWLWQNDNHVDQLEYSQVRQLFLQEKVTGLTIDSGGTLTLELREPVNGSETVRYELYSFQLFYDDFNDLVQQQYAEGIIQHYDYPEPVRTNWLLELLPFLLTAVILMILGPTIWVQILGHEKALFPYEYPALFSIAIAFIGIWVFSATDNSPEGMREREQFRAQFIRSQTGIGIERGQAH